MNEVHNQPNFASIFGQYLALSVDGSADFMPLEVGWRAGFMPLEMGWRADFVLFGGGILKILKKDRVQLSAGGVGFICYKESRSLNLDCFCERAKMGGAELVAPLLFRS